MNKRIQKLFPKEFYAKDDLNLYAEISLKDLNIITDYIEKLEKYGEAVGERRNQLYDKIEKSIEYIKNNIDNTGWLEIGSSNVKELLAILGDEENE